VSIPLSHNINSNARRTYHYHPFQKNNPNRNKAGNPKRDRDSHRPGERGNYASIPSENALYERFYKESAVVPDEEWDDFWGALKRTLPTTFRFTGSRGFVASAWKGRRYCSADVREVDMP